MTLTPAIAIDHETHLQLLIDDTPRKTQRTGVTIYVLTITIRKFESRFIVQKEELRTLTSVQSQCTKLLDDLPRAAQDIHLSPSVERMGCTSNFFC